jgi:hypothetical protein
MQVQVSQAGESVAVVSLCSSRGRDVVGKICHVLEPLRLRVVTASIAARGNTIFHTMFVEVNNLTIACHTSKLLWLPMYACLSAFGTCQPMASPG